MRLAANATTILGDDREVQPDHQLRLLPEKGGAARVVGGFVHGPPELIVEVARSSRRIDLGVKKADYERSGVREYIVVEQDPDRLHWFIRRVDRFESMPAGADGVFRSDCFPGLWLDLRPLLADDLEGVVATLERGLASPEHAAFVARLADLGRGDRVS